MELCVCQELNDVVFTALLKALVAPNAGSISWWPVRASAAAALASLLQVPSLASLNPVKTKKNKNKCRVLWVPCPLWDVRFAIVM